MKKVVIIGGGISGLSAAYYLKDEAQKRGIDLEYALIEKNNRLGGNILTEKVNDFLIEGGPDCFIFEKPWVLELCKKLGLSDEVINTKEGSQTFILWKGRLRALPEGFILMIPTKILPFLFNSLISIFGKLRMALDLVLPKGNPNKDESLGEFVGRRFGREVVEKIAEPLVAGIHAGDPETMSVKSGFPRFIDMEQKHRSLIIAMLKARKKAKEKESSSAKASEDKKRQKYTMFLTLKNGLVELVEAIVEKLGKGLIMTNTSVQKIEKSPEGNSYIVHIEGNKPIEADSVILTTPAYVSAKLIKDIDPAMAADLEKISYVSTATVSLAFKKSDLKQPLRGFGFVVPRLEGRKIMAATFSSQKFPFRAPEDSVLIRCFVGGSQNEELADLEEEEMVRMVRAELADILGISAEPILAKAYKWEKAMSQRKVGHSEIVKSLDEREQQHPGLFLAGSAYEAVGLSDSVRSGELTAKEALKLLKS